MAAYTHKPTIELIKGLEGFTPVAKWDVNRYRIGYGCELLEDGSYVQAGMTITRERGEKILIYNMKVKEKALDSYLSKSIKLNDYQKGALLSYVFSRGEGKFRDSQLRKMVNANPNNSAIPKQFEIEWGTTQQFKAALIVRRTKEGNHYKKIDLGTDSAGSFLSILTVISVVFLLYKFYAT